MAHRSKKKHIKHLHQHEQEAPAANASSEGTRKVRLSTKTVEAARAGIASVRAARAERMAAKPMKSTGNPFKGAGNAGATGTSDKQSAGGKAKRASAKNPGLVRSIASAAGKKIAEAATAKPRRVIRKAKARVKSLFGRSES
jgi:hypothetical protein